MKWNPRWWTLRQTYHHRLGYFLRHLGFFRDLGTRLVSTGYIVYMSLQVLLGTLECSERSGELQICDQTGTILCVVAASEKERHTHHCCANNTCTPSMTAGERWWWMFSKYITLQCYTLSYALKNTANQKSGLPLHILRCATDSIPLPVITCLQQFTGVLLRTSQKPAPKLFNSYEPLRTFLITSGNFSDDFRALSENLKN